MEKIEKFKYPERCESRERGKNVKVVISFLRHVEKDFRGELTEVGRKEAEELGKQKEIPKDGVKLYTSPFRRAIKTMDSIIKGIEKQQEEKKIFRSRYRIELAPPEWKHFDIMAKKAKEIEKKEGSPGVFRYVLSEPLAQKDLDRWSSALAYMIDTYRKAAHRFYSGSEVGLQHITHDLVIGDFLRKVAIFRDKEGRRIREVNFDEIGGPIDFLEGFSVVVNIDNKGEEHLKILFRGKELEIDKDKFKEMVDSYRKEAQEGRAYKGRVSRQDYKNSQS